MTPCVWGRQVSLSKTKMGYCSSDFPSNFCKEKLGDYFFFIFLSIFVVKLSYGIDSLGETGGTEGIFFFLHCLAPVPVNRWLEGFSCLLLLLVSKASVVYVC